MILGVAHIGIAVPSIEVAKKQYELLGFKDMSNEILEETDYGVRVLMMEQGNCHIELLEPLGEDSPINSYVASKPYKMYHLAYCVDDINESIKSLEKQKYVAINKPRLTKSGYKAVFMFNRNLGVIELLEMK